MLIVIVWTASSAAIARASPSFAVQVSVVAASADAVGVPVIVPAAEL